MDKLLDVIEATDFNNPDQEFVGAGLALLSLAISRLEPTEREQTLKSIEDHAVLRQAVQAFCPPVRPMPYPTIMH
jgi:hypothetical protein